jgi:hypothetical protein
MVPGPQKMFSTFPKVRLALKMQKSPVENVWWFGNHNPQTVFRYAVPYGWQGSGNSHKEVFNAILKMFEIFFERKHTQEEIIKGMQYAGEFGNYIKSRCERNQTKVERIAENKRMRFKEKVLKPKLREIFVKREIPKFSNRTGGHLVYMDEVINEKDLKTVDFSNHSIAVFRFKDRNGRVSLNFYSQTQFSNEIRRRRR